MQTPIYKSIKFFQSVHGHVKATEDVIRLCTVQYFYDFFTSVDLLHMLRSLIR